MTKTYFLLKYVCTNFVSTKENTRRSIVITILIVLISTSLRDTLWFTNLSDLVSLNEIQPDSKKFSKFTRSTENFQTHQNSPNRTKIFKDVTYQCPEEFFLQGIQQHGYNAQYSGEASGGRDRVCG